MARVMGMGSAWTSQKGIRVVALASSSGRTGVGWVVLVLAGEAEQVVQLWDGAGGPQKGTRRPTPYYRSASVASLIAYEGGYCRVVYILG